MIIVRAFNNYTGEVWEITSDSHPALENCKSSVEILLVSCEIFNDMFNGTDTEFDRIEVVAK